MLPNRVFLFSPPPSFEASITHCHRAKLVDGDSEIVSAQAVAWAFAAPDECARALTESETAALGISASFSHLR